MSSPAPSRILVVYYSRTGTTREVARRLATALGADLEEIVDHTSRTGPLGFLRSGFEAALRRTPAIEPAAHDPAGYDLVVIGTPTWSSSVSSPVRSYLRHHRAALRRIAFFATCGGQGSPRPFVQMAQQAGQGPVATMIVRQAALPASDATIRRFALQLAPAPASGGDQSPDVVAPNAARS